MHPVLLRMEVNRAGQESSLAGSVKITSFNWIIPFLLKNKNPDQYSWRTYMLYLSLVLSNNHAKAKEAAWTVYSAHAPILSDTPFQYLPTHTLSDLRGGADLMPILL